MKVYFEKSEIKPNNEIASNDIWGKEEIEKRQAQLAKYALKMWSPPSGHSFVRPRSM